MGNIIKAVSTATTEREWSYPTISNETTNENTDEFKEILDSINEESDDESDVGSTNFNSEDVVLLNKEDLQGKTEDLQVDSSQSEDLQVDSSQSEDLKSDSSQSEDLKSDSSQSEDLQAGSLDRFNDNDLQDEKSVDDYSDMPDLIDTDPEYLKKYDIKNEDEDFINNEVFREDVTINSDYETYLHKLSQYQYDNLLNAINTALFSSDGAQTMFIPASDILKDLIEMEKTEYLHFKILSPISKAINYLETEIEGYTLDISEEDQNYLFKISKI